MLDRDIGWGDQNRLDMSKRIEAVLSVIMAHPGRTGATKRHRLDEQMHVDQVDAAAPEGQLPDEPVDGLLVPAEDESGERTSRLRHARHCLVERLVGQDWEDRAEDLVLHDLVLPGDGIEKRRIEV